MMGQWAWTRIRIAGPKSPRDWRFPDAARTAALLAFPPCAARTIFEKHAPCRQVVANTVGGGEIAAPPCRVAIFDQLLDFRDRHRRPVVFGLPQAEHTEHPVEGGEG